VFVEIIFVSNAEVTLIYRAACTYFLIILPAGWDMKNYKCSRGVNCPLWEDDDMLLAEDQRRGGVAPQEAVTPEEVADVSPIHHPVELPPPPPPYQEYRVIGDFDWIHDNGARCAKVHKQPTNVLHSCGGLQAPIHIGHDSGHHLWILLPEIDKFSRSSISPCPCSTSPSLFLLRQVFPPPSALSTTPRLYLLSRSYMCA